MALENSEVLENLIKQKTEIENQIETARVTYLKILGAIDALSQIEESKEGEEETEPEAEETVEDE